MDLGLAGKRAIVLGGSRGIGWYTAALLKQEGAAVALCARGEEGVQDALAAHPLPTARPKLPCELMPMNWRRITATPAYGPTSSHLEQSGSQAAVGISANRKTLSFTPR